MIPIRQLTKTVYNGRELPASVRAGEQGLERNAKRAQEGSFASESIENGELLPLNVRWAANYERPTG